MSIDFHTLFHVEKTDKKGLAGLHRLLPLHGAGLSGTAFGGGTDHGHDAATGRQVMAAVLEWASDGRFSVLVNMTQSNT